MERFVLRNLKTIACSSYYHAPLLVSLSPISQEYHNKSRNATKSSSHSTYADGMGWDKLSGTGVVMFNGMGPGGQSPHALDILLGLKQEREQPN